MLTSSVKRRSSSLPGGRHFSPTRRSGGANDNVRLRLLKTPPKRSLNTGKRFLRALGPSLTLGLIALEAYEIWQNMQPEGWTNLGPWQPYANCGANRNPAYTGPWGKGPFSAFPTNASIRGFTTSGLAGQGTSNVGDPWAGVATYTRCVAIGRTIDAFGSYRMQLQEAFNRPTTGAFSKPIFQEALPAIALQAFDPALWSGTARPELYPPNALPAFTPPVPYHLLHEWEAPNRQASYAPGLASRSLPYNQVYNDFSLALGLNPRTAPRLHTLAPPSAPSGDGTKDKETKRRLGMGQVMILKAISAGTEALDYIDCLYKSLPVSARPRYKQTQYELQRVSVLHKLQAIYDHPDDINIDVLIEELVKNQIEDTIYGAVGRLGGQSSKRLGIPYAAGFNSIASRFRKVYREYQDHPHYEGEN